MTKKAPDFIIDLNGWNYSEFKAYQEILKNDDFESAADYAVEVIRAWPFEQPISVENLVDLQFGDMLAVYVAIGKAIKRSFSEGE